jgi:hypothetical protein
MSYPSSGRSGSKAPVFSSASKQTGTGKPGIVISVATDKNSSKKSTPVASIGVSARHIETALGTIAPKAVLTLPPVPAASDEQKQNHQPSKAAETSPRASLINVQEVLTVGLPGLPGIEDDLTVRRRKPMVIQQLIKNQILKKPGINIADAEGETKFSILGHYGCQEEPLDDLLLVTFHLLVKMPVQAAADMIVDMPEWMRKKFLSRFKLPALVNEVLSARLDDYEQPEDDVLAVTAEVVWSNALAAGSVAESAATFFPQIRNTHSSLNRLRIGASSQKIRSLKDVEVLATMPLTLPSFTNEDNGAASVEVDDDMISGMESLQAYHHRNAQDDSVEDRAQSIFNHVWGTDGVGSLVDASSVADDKMEITPETASTVIAAESHLTFASSDHTSLELPPMPASVLAPTTGRQASGKNEEAAALDEAAKKTSLVKLDQGNLVLL